MAVSLRQCVACRQKFPKETLIRIVRSLSGETSIDTKQRLPGRGFYSCRNSNCLEKVRKRRILDHVTGKPIPESLYLEMACLLQNSSESYIGFARKSREIIMGITALEKGFDQGKIHLLLMDEDTQKWTRRKMEFWSEKMDIPMIILARQRLESLTGRVGCRTAGITHSGLASSIIDAYAKPPNPKR
ncbi:MAG TPA: DUF448 domain-containing protein [bacterium]|nr:DUF448 domain-containing protein [bacterium]